MKTEPSSGPGRPLWRIVLDPILVLTALAAVTVSMEWRRATTEEPAAVVDAPPAVEAVAPEPAPPLAPAEAEVVAAAPVEPDPKLVAQAEAELDGASRDRARADDRELVARQELEKAQIEAAQAARGMRTLGRTVRNPSISLASHVARGQRLAGEVKTLQGEVASLATNPRPRREPLLDRSPVARIVDGEEFHFELYRNRVTYIDLDRLVERVKSDAKLQLRMAGPTGGDRPIVSTVGPVGAFSLRYELGHTGASTVRGGMLDVTYGLLGWELIPEREGRGETYEAAMQPVSDFRRALNALNPAKATITLWVYPDSFTLFRQLRDQLHLAGYTVAGRPLPAAMPIRGSPDGSMSAAQ